MKVSRNIDEKEQLLAANQQIKEQQQEIKLLKNKINEFEVIVESLQDHINILEHKLIAANELLHMQQNEMLFLREHCDHQQKKQFAGRKRKLIYEENSDNDDNNENSNNFIGFSGAPLPKRRKLIPTIVPTAPRSMKRRRYVGSAEEEEDANNNCINLSNKLEQIVDLEIEFNFSDDNEDDDESDMF